MKLPPEPGLVPDPDLGVPSNEVVFNDDGRTFVPEVNDDEEEEDDD